MVTDRGPLPLLLCVLMLRSARTAQQASDAQQEVRRGPEWPRRAQKARRRGKQGAYQDQEVDDHGGLSELRESGAAVLHDAGKQKHFNCLLTHLAAWFAACCTDAISG
jgi:hypothetical protein